VGFVVKLEQQVIGVALVVIGDLTPQVDEAVFQHCRVNGHFALVLLGWFAIELAVVMHIDDDVQALDEKVIHDLIHPGQKLRV